MIFNMNYTEALTSYHTCNGWQMTNVASNMFIQSTEVQKKIKKENIMKRFSCIQPIHLCMAIDYSPLCCLILIHFCH